MRAIIIIECEDGGTAGFCKLADGSINANKSKWLTEDAIDEVIRSNPNWKFQDTLDKLKELGFDLHEVETCESTF